MGVAAAHQALGYQPGRSPDSAVDDAAQYHGTQSAVDLGVSKERSCTLLVLHRCSDPTSERSGVNHGSDESRSVD